MYRTLNEYLHDVNSYLKPLSEDDRWDIVKEIESNALELQRDRNLSLAQLTEHLGSPKELAKSYLGDAIANTRGYGIKRICRIAAFYSLAGLTGMIVLPVTGILSVSFLFCAIVVPLAGLVKWLAAMLGFDLPFIMFQIGNYAAAPFPAFLLSLISAVIFWVVGKWFWRLTVRYVNTVTERSKKYSMPDKTER